MNVRTLVPGANWTSGVIVSEVGKNIYRQCLRKFRSSSR
jgi:hypothetical protein